QDAKSLAWPLRYSMKYSYPNQNPPRPTGHSQPSSGNNDFPGPNVPRLSKTTKRIKGIIEFRNCFRTFVFAVRTFQWQFGQAGLYRNNWALVPQCGQKMSLAFCCLKSSGLTYR